MHGQVSFPWRLDVLVVNEYLVGGVSDFGQR